MPVKGLLSRFWCYSYFLLCFVGRIVESWGNLVKRRPSRLLTNFGYWLPKRRGWWNTLVTTLNKWRNTYPLECESKIFFSLPLQSARNWKTAWWTLSFCRSFDIRKNVFKHEPINFSKDYPTRYGPFYLQTQSSELIHYIRVDQWFWTFSLPRLP